MRKAEQEKPTRTYVVRVDGYGPVYYKAASPGKARAQCYRDFCEAICRKTFREFLGMSCVRPASDLDASP